MASGDTRDTIADHESRSLLNDQSTVEAQDSRHLPSTLLPKVSFAALCVARLVDPLAFSQIFPYINEYIGDLHIASDPSQIGFYSGLVESAYAVSQLCSIYQWAKVSDIIGRRPVIILGIAGMSISTFFFGLSKTLTGLLIARFLAGFFSGNVSVVHSTLGELTDKSNEADAYSIFGLFWPLGTIIGPLIGGLFSHPAEKFPTLFDNRVFQAYPYFLPCIIAGALGLIGSLYAYIFLDETLPTKRRVKIKRIAPRMYGAVENTDTKSIPAEVHEAHEPVTIMKLLSIPVIFALTATGFALNFLATAFDVVFVLFCYSPVQSGGLSFTATEIGYSLALGGALGITLQVAIAPYLFRRFDTARLYKFCMDVIPLLFITLPVLNLIARAGLDESGSMNSKIAALLWVAITLLLLVSRVAFLGYCLSMLLIKEHTPNPESFSAINGLVQFSMALARCLSPFIASACFAYSLKNLLFGGYFWVLVMCVLCLVGSCLARKIPPSSRT